MYTTFKDTSLASALFFHPSTAGNLLGLKFYSALLWEMIFKQTSFLYFVYYHSYLKVIPVYIKMQELWEACSHGYLLRAFDWQGRKNPQVPY
jgi:hypothetical protein